MARLPRLPRTVSLVEPSKLDPRSWVATLQMQRWWQRVVEAIERNEGSADFGGAPVNAHAVAQQVAEEMQLLHPPATDVRCDAMELLFSIPPAAAVQVDPFEAALAVALPHPAAPVSDADIVDAVEEAMLELIYDGGSAVTESSLIFDGGDADWP